MPNGGNANSEYENYQLEWMQSHEFTAHDLMREFGDYLIETMLDELRGNRQDAKHILDGMAPNTDNLLEEAIRDWDNDVGFGGMIWASELEWENCENRHSYALEQALGKDETVEVGQEYLVFCPGPDPLRHTAPKSDTQAHHVLRGNPRAFVFKVDEHGSIAALSSSILQLFDLDTRLEKIALRWPERPIGDIIAVRDLTEQNLPHSSPGLDLFHEWVDAEMENLIENEREAEEEHR